MTTTPTPTQATSTPKQAPTNRPADGPGEPEEAGYAAEAEAMASSIFDAFSGLYEEEDSSGGIEAPVSEDGEPQGAMDQSETTGSPAAAPEQVAPATPTSTQEPAKGETVAQQPTEAPAAPAQPAAPGQAASQPAEQQQPAAGATSQEQPTGVGTELLQRTREHLEASRAQFVDALAKTHYAISEDEAAEILTDPAKVLSKLAANAHVTITQNILGTMAQVLPAVIHGVQEARRANDQGADEFFSAWPNLDRNADGPTVVRLAQIYRQANPQATKEQMIKELGAMVSVQLGKLPQQAAPVQAQAAPVAAAGAYRPAQAAPAAVQPQPAPTNPWAEMAEYLEE